MRVVVTGSRHWLDARAVRMSLDEYFNCVAEVDHGSAIARVAAGDATGVDDAAIMWARSKGLECAVYPAEWTRYGRIAGPARNERMLLAERPTALLAFPGGAGTDDCVKRARRLGILIVHMRYT